MAKLTSVFSFSGSLDGISVYKMEGVDKPVVRKKGGAPKEKILHDPCFANTRRVMHEFGGRSTATRYLKEAFSPFRPGHGTTGTINKLLAALQKMDAVSPWGRRSVALSLCPQLLQGFNISTRLTLDSVLHHSLSCQLSKENRTASLAVPPLLPGVNCTHPKAYPFFRVIAVLGMMPDLLYKESIDKYGPREGYRSQTAQSIQTSWLQTNSSSEATTLELALPEVPGVEGYSLMLSVAIQYGKLNHAGDIEPAPKAEASKILAVV